jgi:hypothetical protein
MEKRSDKNLQVLITNVWMSRREDESQVVPTFPFVLCLSRRKETRKTMGVRKSETLRV